MESLVNSLLSFIGADITALYTFPELISWFVTILIGSELVLFVLDGVFYAARNIARGLK